MASQERRARPVIRRRSDRQAALPQLRAQAAVVDEHDAVQARGPGRLDVLRLVVDEHALVERPAAALGEELEDPGSGLASRSSPETTMSSNSVEEVEAVAGPPGTARPTSSSARAGVRRPRAGRAARRPWPRSRRSATGRSSPGRPGCARASAACGPPRPRSDSSNARPASCSWFQAPKSKSSAARNGPASSSPTAAAIAGCGSQSISTLPRSKTTAPAVRVAHFQRSEAGHEVEGPRSPV